MSLLSTPLNCILIAGSVSRAGVLRYGAGGSPYLVFGLSFSEYQRGGEGGYEERASFIDCVVFGKRAEEYDGELYKGRKIGVTGRLHWDKYIDSRGGDRSKHQIRVDRIDFASFALAGEGGGDEG